MVPPGWIQDMATNLNHKVQGNPNASVSDRVRNALTVAASTSRIDSSAVQDQVPPSSSLQLMSSVQSPVLQSVPNTNFLNSPKKQGNRGPKKQDNNRSVPNALLSSLNPSSANVVIKNRFKHTKPILATHNITDKKMKSALDQIQEYNDKPSSAGQSSSIVSTNSSPAQCVTTIKKSYPRPMKYDMPVAVLPSPMQTISLACPQNVSQPTAHAPIPCPACKGGSQTTSIGNNFYKCFKCDKTYVSVHRVNVNQSPTAFYGLPSTKSPMSTSSMTTTAPSLSAKKRHAVAKASPKPSKKKKTIETVDLVSSDEEEKESSPSTDTCTSATVTCPSTTNSHVSASGIASRMRLPGGAIQARPNTPTPPPILQQPLPQLPASPSPAPAPSVTPPLPNGEYKFHCNKAMFGELYGCTLAPTRVAENRMYLSLECNINRENTTISEKYTLSVGQNDVQQIMIYFGRVPSFVAIETAPRFAEVACRRIGRDVLMPSSEDHKKRYIILALVSAFKNDNEAAVEINHLISCVSPWARTRLLNLQEAATLISNACLDVNQKELCYGAQIKPAVPVETLLIYPSPPKPGGIPVTNEDLACLADGTYLNDIIIDFYLKYLCEDILTPAQRAKTYMFNSYFYKRLTQKSSKATPSQMHAAVKKWTRNVDIFDKDFIIIPVNEHCHWYLVVVCFPDLMVSNTEDLNEKDEEESEDEAAADFIKETSSSAEVNNSQPPNTEENLKSKSSCTDQAQQQVSLTQPVKNEIPKLSSPENNSSKSGSLEAQKNEKIPNQTSDVELHTSPTGELSNSAVESPTGKSSNSAEKGLTGGSSNSAIERPTGESSNSAEKGPSVESSNSAVEGLTGESSNSAVEGPTDESSNSVTAGTDQVTPAVTEKVVYKQAFESDDFLRPCILIFDSLVGSGHSRVFTNLRHYLTEEWSSRKRNVPARVFDKTNMKGCYPKIPRQNNDCDCGVFLLQYVESFFTQSIRNFHIPIHLESWFTLEYVSRKRELIKDLISNLATEYKNSR